WFVVFAINLDIIQYIIRFFKIFLNEPHAIGEFSFTLGNLFLFIIILGISNWFQKNLPLFFSKSPGKVDQQEVETRGSRIALLRLIVVIGGFLFGVSALG